MNDIIKCNECTSVRIIMGTQPNAYINCQTDLFDAANQLCRPVSKNNL